MAGNGVNGGGLMVAAVGGVLAYAGFTGQSPLQALRSIASGHPAGLLPSGGAVGDAAAAIGQAVSSVPQSTVAGAAGAAIRAVVVAASAKYRGDIYSQPKRTQPGYSDCSSFVDKCLRDAGIKPPNSPWAASGNYRLSPEWVTIPRSQAQPGDIAISSKHMILITGAGGSSAIGQEDYGVNVKTGTPEQLFGKQVFWFRTWKGYAAATAGGTSNPQTGHVPQ